MKTIKIPKNYVNIGTKLPKKNYFLRHEETEEDELNYADHLTATKKATKEQVIVSKI